MQVLRLHQAVYCLQQKPQSKAVHPGRQTPKFLRKSTPPRPRQPWEQLFKTVEKEFIEPVALEILHGSIPKDLHGTLYRNGPGKFEVQGEPIRHPFDAEAMLQAIDIGPKTLTYRSRHIETREQKREKAAGRRLYGGVGWQPRGGMLGMLRGFSKKNNANTNIVQHAGKLLALYEGGLPYTIDPDTLETGEEYTFDGMLKPRDTFSAHPKFHPTTGDMWNFGVTLGPKNEVHLFRVDRHGRGTRTLSFDLPFMSITHDFFLTETKAIFVVSPLVINALGVVTGLRTPRQAVTWQPQHGTQVYTVDLQTQALQHHTLEPFLTFHGINGWDEADGTATVDLCSYTDGRMLPMLHDMMGGNGTPFAPAQLSRLRVGPNGAKRELLQDMGLDFPRLPDAFLGKRTDTVLGVTWGHASPMPYVPVQIDLNTGRTATVELLPNEFAGECVPISKPGATVASDAYWLSVVHNGNAGRSELRIYDGSAKAVHRTPAQSAVKTLDALLGTESPEPDSPPEAPEEIFRAALPQALPFGFHGNWLPAAQPGLHNK
jgi:all-trans-8'-apo-beta-carotenal 15,15'-oxygenase